MKQRTECTVTQINEVDFEEFGPDSKHNRDSDDSDEQENDLVLKQTSSALEAELKAGGFFGKNCYWITCSLFAGLTMGTGSALFATHYADLRI